jgi:cytochrome b561
MSFQVKSAWVMALLLTVAGGVYFVAVRDASQALGTTAPAVVVVSFVLLVVVGSLVTHLVLALASPRQASAPTDERDRQLLYRAGHGSSYVLAIGVMLSLGHYLVHGDGNMLFHLTMASLIAAQIAEYGLQIALDRMRL